MEPGSLYSPKWNIFARELERILQARGYGLGHLDDRSHIHPEKVRRLQRSLREPRFNLLSPVELERVGDVFEFTSDERMQLRAAVLATAIEDMLMSRIEADAALMASDQVFDILLEALQTHGDDSDGIGAVKGVSLASISSEQTQTPWQAALEEAVADIDRAYLLLHLALADDSLARMRTAMLARESFLYALAALHRLGASATPGEEWSYWRDEAQRGLTLAETSIGAWSPGDPSDQTKYGKHSE